MTRDVSIQYQDAPGNWITSVTVPNQPPVILIGMKSVAVLFPGSAFGPSTKTAS